MKKTIALGLAGALALGSFAATTATADAAPFHRGGAVAAGALFGFALGALAANSYYYYPNYYYGPRQVYPLYPSYAYRAYPAYPSYAYAGNGHVSWCEANYRSYVRATDSFVGYDGYVHRCVSPY
jgi:hypothetical protein